MKIWLLMLLISGEPHSYYFEKQEDCLSTGNGFIDAYRNTEISGYCFPVWMI